MKSVVFPYKTSRENKELLKELRRKQSIVIRTAYNEYFEGNMDVKNITDKVSKYGLDLPATFVLYGIREGKAIFDS